MVRDTDGKKRLVLLDFGSARNFVSADKSGSYTAYVTAGYAPYEQYIQHGKQGPYTDVYSVCATMYAVMSGKIPDEAIARKSGEAELQDFSSLGINVPERVSRAIMHGLAVDGADRPQSMRELYDEMNNEEAPVKAKRETKKTSADTPELALYTEGKRLMSAGSRAGAKQALKLFEQISGYQDADNLAEACRRKIDSAFPARILSKKTLFFILAAVLAASAGILLFSKLSGRNVPVPTETAAIVLTAGMEEPPAVTTEAEQTKIALDQTLEAVSETQQAIAVSGTNEVLRKTQMLVDMMHTETVAAKTQAAEPTLTATATEAPVFTNTPAATVTEAPAFTNTPAPTEIPGPKSGMGVNSIKVGDILTLGRYEQDGDLNNGQEVIEWQVLTIENGQALLISKYGLDTKKYHEKYESATWETCSLRAWLNGEFYDNTFSSEEKGWIREETLKNPNNAEYGTKGGNDTTDRIFLLSIDEAGRYLRNADAQAGFPTAYAIKNGAESYENIGGDWWLRSPGDQYDFAAYYCGSVHYKGVGFSALKVMVRPAFWLELTTETYIAAEPDTAAGPDTQPAVGPSSGMEISDAKVGDIITLGQYEQDSDLTNGAEAIEWQVLKTEKGRVLVVSKYVLDTKPFNAENQNVTWETSTLRTWLNGEFYNSAFSHEEKARIQQVTVKDLGNARYGNPGGNDTTDLIFLLSIEEAEQYFPDDEARKCHATSYAKKNGAIVQIKSGGMMWAEWWLRSPGDTFQTATVSTSGWINAYGHLVNYDSYSVRPAFWLDLTTGTDTEPVQTKISETTVKAGSVKTGDTFKLGHYEQDADLTNGPEGILWQVLAVEEDRALVVSRYGLDTQKYNEELEGEQYRKGATWETCGLRAWLNREFFNNAFSSDEKVLIREVTLKNPDNPLYKTNGGNDTADRIFLLSIDEAEQYFPDDEARRCWPTTYAKNNGADVNKSGGSGWWLRSSGTDNNLAAYAGRSISYSGVILYYLNNVKRPAFWLDLTGDTEITLVTGAKPQYTDTQETAAVPKRGMEISEAKAGDMISLGSYEQDGDLANGAEAIEWQVLAVEEGRVLVVSRYALNAKPYNETEDHVTWETCSLRAWLNGEFYNSAFSSEEKVRIRQETLKNPDNEKTKGGNDTTDRIFLLSLDEAYQYFENNEARECLPTTYAVNNGAGTMVEFGDTTWWWLRSPGSYSDKDASRVSVFGRVEYFGHRGNISTGAVRPTLWLDLPAGTGKPGVTGAEPVPATTPETEKGATAGAEPILTNTSETKGAEKPLQETEAAAVSDFITMGRYEQDGSTANGAEAIEWQMLKVEDGRALMISRYGLDAMPYNTENQNVTWETSTLRTWLNGEFYNSVFTEDEKGRIHQVTLKNPDNEEKGTKGGNDTTDRIFLLNVDEANRYFANDEARKCRPTAYAISRGAGDDKDSGGAWWWLRTPGSNLKKRGGVNSSGTIRSGGGNVNYSSGTARPAFWLDLTTGTDTKAGTGAEQVVTDLPETAVSAEPVMKINEVQAGDIITLGQYEQDSDQTKGAEAIEWQVLKVEEGRALVISKYGLDMKLYNEEWIDVSWETCTLRAWLNGEFYNKAFSSAEKGRIQQVTVKTPENVKYGKQGGNDTTDKIFLLSITEAEQYFRNNEARKCQPTAYAEKKGAYVVEDYGGTSWWWLRSPGRFYDFAARVYADGGVNADGSHVGLSSGVVRPAFWLDL